jgi:hypothetical protein
MLEVKSYDPSSHHTLLIEVEAETIRFRISKPKDKFVLASVMSWPEAKVILDGMTQLAQWPTMEHEAYRRSISKNGTQTMVMANAGMDGANAH